MFNVKNSVIVPYSVEKMFFLVNNISSYSDFIPGCVNSRILENGDSELTAEVDIFKFGIQESFITHNIMVKNRSIVVQLIDGPFKSLFGNWNFVYIDQEVSMVECDFHCEFYSVLRGSFLNYIVEEVINDIISSFIVRAHEIYK